MERVTLVTVHNAFDRSGRDTRTLDSGLTLAEIKAQHLPANVDFALSINGRVCADLEIIPRSGDMVTAVPVITGGNDGKMIGRIIAMVVLTIVASVAQQYWANTLIWGMNAGTLAAGAIMVVGGMLINMAFQASAPNGLQSYGDNVNNSPSYGWSPQSTQQQGIVLPRWYGKNRLYGNIIVAHILYSGKDSYINTLIDMGLGPFKGLSDFKINDQPMQNFIGVQTPDIRLGYLDQPVITDFTETSVEYSTSQIASFSAPAIYTTQGDNFDALEILVRFPRGLGEYTPQGSIISLGVNYALYVSPTGLEQWQSLSLPALSVEILTGWKIGKWVQIGDNRVWVMIDIIIPDWAYSYVIVTDEFSNNEIIQSGMPFLSPVAAPDTATVYSEDLLSSVELDLAKVSGRNGYVWQLFAGESVQISYADEVVETSWAIAAQASALNISRTISVPIKGRYDIKLERLSPDYTEATRMHEIYLASVTEITRQQFTYPRQVLVGLKALATNQLSGSLRFSCLGECSLVRIWDGATWSVGYSTNPAWICYDVLTQPVFDNALTVIRYDGIDPARVNHSKFKEWADYCDEQLPDGNGGTEKRVEFNGGFDSEMDVWAAVLRICSVAYAVPHRIGNIYTVYVDKPAEPVQLFSLGNIDQDSFKENFLPMEDRAAEIEIDFVNEENNYQRDKLTVINTSITTVNSKVNLSLFGITKPSMAWRAGMRKLAYNQHITRTIEFGADIDAISCTVGDVILTQHDVPQWGYGGRIISATTGAITIDQIITLAPGLQYAILVRMGDDTLVERNITNAPGDATVLTVSPAFPSAPKQYDVFTVGEILKTAKPFRVSDIARDGDLKAKISAVEYVPAVYDVDYDIPATPVINYSQALTNYKQSLPPFESIVSVSVSETLRMSASGLVSTVVTIQWAPVVNRYAFPAVNIWAWQDNTSPVKISNTAITSDSFEWIVPNDGVYWNFAVAVVNLNGESQSVLNTIPARKFIFGKTTAPSSITDFNFTQVVTGGLRFSWSAVADLDVFEYIIRYSPLTTGAAWASATEIIRTSATYANLSIAQTGTYLIKAIDTTGHYSATADTVIISNIPSIVGLTHHSLIDEAPVWGGFLTNMIVSSGKLQPAWTSGMPESGIIPPFVGRYTFGSEVDFGEPRSARVSAALEWTASPTPIDNITDLDAWVNIDGASGKSWAKVYIKTSQDASDPTFKQPLFSGDFIFQRASFEIEIFAYGSDIVYGVACPITIDLHDISLTI